MRVWGMGLKLASRVHNIFTGDAARGTVAPRQTAELIQSVLLQRCQATRAPPGCVTGQRGCDK